MSAQQISANSTAPYVIFNGNNYEEFVLSDEADVTTHADIILPHLENMDNEGKDMLLVSLLVLYAIKHVNNGVWDTKSDAAKVRRGHILNRILDLCNVTNIHQNRKQITARLNEELKYALEICDDEVDNLPETFAELAHDIVYDLNSDMVTPPRKLRKARKAESY